MSLDFFPSLDELMSAIPNLAELRLWLRLRPITHPILKHLNKFEVQASRGWGDCSQHNSYNLLLNMLNRFFNILNKLKQIKQIMQIGLNDT